jgi:hypothetical protein
MLVQPITNMKRDSKKFEKKQVVEKQFTYSNEERIIIKNIGEYKSNNYNTVTSEDAEIFKWLKTGWKL